jgi:anti-sigma factor RsiW
MTPPTLTPGGITDQELHAFLDGELDEVGAARVRAALAASAELAGRLAGLSADKALLARVYGPLAAEKLPDALVAAVYHVPVPKRTVRSRIGGTMGWQSSALSMAAAVALVVLGWFSWPALHQPGREPMIEAALAARSGTLHADEKFAASSLMSAGERDRLLAQTLGVPVKAPNLEKAGFRLQTVSVYAGQAVQLSYQNAQGHAFTVYLHAPDGPDRFELRTMGEMRVCIWQNEDLTAVMLGEMSSSEMLRVASLTYADLNF